MSPQVGNDDTCSPGSREDHTHLQDHADRPEDDIAHQLLTW